MGEVCKMTYTVNTGLLIQCGKTKILLDSIFGAGGHRFSSPSQTLWQQIKQGEGIFSQVQYLLFSHDHADHFSAEMTLEYLQMQKVKGIFLPEDAGGKWFLDAIVQRNVPCLQFPRCHPQYRTYLLSQDVRLKAYAMRHQGEAYRDVAHMCFLLTMQGEKFLFTADVDFVHEDFSLFSNMNFTAVFVNPLFFHSKEGQCILREQLRTKEVVVYHLPFEADDLLHMRRMAQRDALQWKDTAIRLLLEPMQTWIWE